MTGAATKVYETTTRKNDQRAPIREHELINLRLNVELLGVLLKPRDINLVIEVSDVAQNGLALHGLKVSLGDNVDVTRCCNKDICDRSRCFHRYNLEALHRGLKRADRVDLGD